MWVRKHQGTRTGVSRMLVNSKTYCEDVYVTEYSSEILGSIVESSKRLTCDLCSALYL